MAIGADTTSSKMGTPDELPPYSPPPLLCAGNAASPETLKAQPNVQKRGNELTTSHRFA